MYDKRGFALNALLAAGGFTVWFAISAVFGLREAWDGSGFLPYTVSMLALNAAAGFMRPGRALRDGILSVCLQPAAIFLRSGEIGSLFPIGLAAFLVLGLLFGLAGKAGGLVKLRFSGPKP